MEKDLQNLKLLMALMLQREYGGLNEAEALVMNQTMEALGIKLTRIDWRADKTPAPTNHQGL